MAIVNVGPFRLEGQISKYATGTFLSPATGNLVFIVGPGGLDVPMQFTQFGGRFNGGTSCSIYMKILRATGRESQVLSGNTIGTVNTLEMATADTDYLTSAFAMGLAGIGDKLYVAVNAVSGSVGWITFSLKYKPMIV